MLATNDLPSDDKVEVLANEMKALKVDEKPTVYIGKLAPAANESDIKTLFETVAPIKVLRIIHRKQRNFGFAVFESIEQCQQVIDAFNGQEVAGNAIKLQMAQAKIKSKRSSRKIKPKKSGDLKDGDQPDDEKAAAKKKLRRRSSRFNKQSGDKSDKPRSTTILYIGNVTNPIVDEEFTSFLSENSIKYKDVKVARGTNGKSIGFGFASFNNEEECKDALNLLENAKFKDVQVKVRYAYEDTVVP